MSFFVYVFVLLVAASSVLFGLDWMQAPLQPPARPQQSATLATAPTQPVAAPTPSNPNASPANPNPGATAIAPATPLTDAAGANMTTGSTPIEDKPQAPEATPAPLCDVSACERAYRSFTAVDCTYQPSWGERRLCTKGTPPRRASSQSSEKEANAQAHCNISACEAAYQSFDAATCTYQSYAGGRRACTK